jgi:hypothetical protein
MTLFCGSYAPAQVSKVGTSKPIVIKSPKPVKERPEKFLGVVMSATSLLIIVRGQENPMAVRTFSYAPDIRDKAAYNYGDRVEIFYKSGTDVASRIKVTSKKR